MKHWNNIAKSLLFTLALALGIAFIGTSPALAWNPDNGDYTISNADDLAAFRDAVNEGNTFSGKTITLEADIDLSSICHEGGDSWTPIGNYTARFTGTFDGRNHTIEGLYISNSADYQGLFGFINDGTVQNLAVSGEVTANNYVGGVVGFNYGGSVTNCINSNIVTAQGSYSYVGGVVGFNYDGSTTNCTNTDTGTVTAEGSGFYVGGVVGSNNGGKVINCTNSGKVTAEGSSSNVGGVVGRNYEDCNVTNCTNSGTVIAEVSSSYAGGVVGANYGIVTNCTNSGAVTTESDFSYVGGVVGYHNVGTVTNCYNIGAVTATAGHVGGVVGLNYNTVTGCYYLQDDNLPGIGSGSGSANSLSKVDFADSDNFTGWNFEETWSMSPLLGRPVLQANPEGGDGTSENPYEIDTAEKLQTFATIVNGTDNLSPDADACAILTADINLSGVCSQTLGSWTPIGTYSSNAFTGTFNGDSHTISGLYINNSADYQGLFGYVKGGTVQNLIVSGKVTANNYVGGVVGSNDGGNITDCTNNATVTSTLNDYTFRYVGGVVGNNFSNNSKVTNCTNSGTVTSTGDYSYVGGVVGGNDGTVTNCTNSGKVTAVFHVGGVVGDNDSGTVANCTNRGAVTATGDYAYVGGVVGNNYNRIVTNCHNTGTVTTEGSSSYAGGVVGNNSFSTVKNCYNTGAVSGSGDVGGVVGYNSSSTVENCYYLTGTASADVGNNTGTIKNVASKTSKEFASGEVAWLLQSEQTEDSSGSVPQVWGQRIGTDEYPVLTAFDNEAPQVYQLTFKWDDGASKDDVLYTNGTVTPPTAPVREGYTLSGWTPSDTIVTADTTFTAQWTTIPTYTVTVGVSPSEGGTVTSSATNAAEGSSVTVTATPASGYRFIGWQEGDTIVSRDASYTFTLDADRNLTALFEQEPTTPSTPSRPSTPSEPEKPSGPSTGDSAGWDDIRDEITGAEDGDTITIEMNGETEVPADIFEEVAGKDVDVVFDMGDGVKWEVHGTDIPADANFSDLDLGVSMNTSGIPVNVINAITGEATSVQITLAHDGDFGFVLTLSAPLGEENAGYWANLYHYDEDAEQLNFETAAEIEGDGTVKLRLTHASQYAIVIDDHSHAPAETTPVSDLFTDVSPDDWYIDAVQYAYDQGLMTGTSATTFEPNTATTRGMIVSILYRLEGNPDISDENLGYPFADVDASAWYADPVYWARMNGIVAGFEDNTFGPNKPITREQLAAILYNYAQWKGMDVSARTSLDAYTDQPSPWAEDVSRWAVAEGLLTGITEDTLAPQASATRAQVAAIFQRFLSE